jgi:hypothetical protein
MLPAAGRQDLQDRLVGCLRDITGVAIP